MPKGLDGHLNWETPEGIDWESFSENLTRVKKQLETEETVPYSINIERPGWVGGIGISRFRGQSLHENSTVIIFVEGFLLFANEKIAKFCDKRIWIEILQRRFSREMKGLTGRKKEFEEWFNGEVWVHYLENREKQLSNSEPLTLIIEGKNGEEIVFEEAKNLLGKICLGGVWLPH
eukprot:TRINITY_DN1218_c0_g2_i20.p1 TRINITY_DN1218_c0_g2~~TRINITY_DN1218_c0_g2_i20.p1  ORF type:complete len:176 (+),score=18.82 TRINITY_DN1218_c0_g2_i20:1608-2135(+)